MMESRARSIFGRSRIAVVFLVLTVCMGPGCSSTKRSEPAASDHKNESLTILETLLLPQESWTANSGNSFVGLDTPGIRKVAAMGPAALPPLLQLMRDEALSFHTFAFCAATSERILREHDPQYKLPWGGGLRVDPLPTGMLMKPDGQMLPMEFRRDVAADVEKRARELELIGKQ